MDEVVLEAVTESNLACCVCPGQSAITARGLRVTSGLGVWREDEGLLFSTVLSDHLGYSIGRSGQ